MTWKPNDTFRIYKFLLQEREKLLNTVKKNVKKSKQRKRGLFLALLPPEFQLLLFNSQGNKDLSSSIFTNFSPTYKYKLSTWYDVDWCCYSISNTFSCIHVLIKVKLDDPSNYPLHLICQSYKSQRKMVPLYCEKRKTPNIVMKKGISSCSSFQQQLFTTKTFSQNWIFMRNPHVLLIFCWHQTDSPGSFICSWWITLLIKQIALSWLWFPRRFSVWLQVYAAVYPWENSA